MTRYFFAVLMVCAAVPAWAQSEAARIPSGRPCLQQGNIRDFQYVLGNRSLIVTDTARVRYRLTFISRCYDIDHEFGLQFKGRGAGRLSCVAQGDTVMLRSGGSNRECIVRDVDYQTPLLDRSDMAVMGTGRH